MSEAIIQLHAQILFNPSEDAMSKKVKLQDLSIANFDQKLDMPDIKGGKICIRVPQIITLPGLLPFHTIWVTRCFF